MRRKNNHSLKLLTSILFGVLAVSAAYSQSTDPAWLDGLSHQLAAENQCRVDYYINISEGRLGGLNTYEARAQCRDGRQFDASKTEPDEKFVIRPCGTVVC